MAGARGKWASLLPALVLVGCAGFGPPDDDVALMSMDPKAAYSAARIAEGAYLASGHVDPDVLARLVVLDQRARHALDAWQSAPNGDRTERVRGAVAELTAYLVRDAQF